jgi:biotin carboxylase
MGDKVSAKQAMIKTGVPCVPGSDGELSGRPDRQQAHRAVSCRSS